MSVGYKAVGWNRQKKIYDLALVAGVAAFLALFTVVSLVAFPHVTAEILLIRAFGTAALFLLHVVLCIGPLARLDRRFLPLLYNRRHLGVTTFLLGFVHSVLVVVTYHTGSDLNPIVSVFVSDAGASVSQFPFQAFGFIALVILFLMAATSHDFWLANLTAPVWKTLHMLVYVAYAALVVHVVFGALQSESNPLYAAAMFLGVVLVVTLHCIAATREKPKDAPREPAAPDGFVEVCAVEEIPEHRARIATLAGERVAVFRYDGKISAVSNVCQHQNGPLGEGRIVKGCITCPWHGYQYLPDTGASPPPFTEKVPTFRVKVADRRVWVDPRPNPPGTRVEPAIIEPN